ELPAFDGASIYDVRYQDADVIIALDDPDVSATPVLQESFNVLLTIPVGGISQTFVRGYQAVAATVDGFDFTFVNTHLEVGGPSGPVQEAQAAELQAVIDAIDGPVVLAGDLNSRADGSGTDSYELLTTSLEDVFDHPSLLPEPTCCQRSDLENEDSELTSRIDFVLYEGFDRVLRAETLLDEYGDRVQANGDLLWPSDHAGVAALLVYNLRRARPHS
ncbi:MAG: endonuclease/exonuclease/phosphatase family protein, partial [Candidatus Wenzhouxiangella sp. M2_3B_020]